MKLFGDERLTIDPSHVGNSMATFAMQSLGCEVAALNTVHFSMLYYQRLGDFR